MNIKVYIITILIILFCGNLSYGSHKHKESYYQHKFCMQLGGQEEVFHYAGDSYIRVDCETNDLAIEFDFAYKWAEAFGQAQLYHIITKKTPAIVLIVEKERDLKHIQKLLLLRKLLYFKLFIIYNINGDY